MTLGLKIVQSDINYGTTGINSKLRGYRDGRNGATMILMQSSVDSKTVAELAPAIRDFPVVVPPIAPQK